MSSRAVLEDFLVRETREAVQTSGYWYLGGLETSGVTASKQNLFFVGKGERVLENNGDIKMNGGAQLSTGVFRNSFYHSIWTTHTQARRILLAVQGAGRIRINVFQSAPDKVPQLLLSKEIELGMTETSYVRLPDMDSLWSHGRLFWDVEALSDEAVIHRAYYVTSDQPVRQPKLVVLIRTFGRTGDVIRLLEDIAAQAVSEEHENFLNETKFVVLDTSPNALGRYEPIVGGKQLNIAVIDGANLGGGGNAAQMFFRLREVAASHPDAFDEIIVTDDDLEITIESLCRYRAFTRFRSQDMVMTCPILMKSEPTVVWEDGGYWGRFHPEQMSAKRSSLFPRLLKHAWRLTGFDHVDEFGRPTYPEYATFIFFAGPRTLMDKLGYPAAFFLRGDDVEFSLRAGANSYKMVSNPNFCAWHEPAHSYGQEYMAILHGIIINFRYGVREKSVFMNFFNNRFHAHASYRDALGLDVYVKVLESLVGTHPVLRADFQDHYFTMLGHFKKSESKFELVERRLVDEVITTDREKNSRLIPFLYMAPNPSSNTKTVILENFPHKTFAFRNIDDAEQNEAFYSTAALFSLLLNKFLESFDAISEKYSNRLAESAQSEFWQPIFENVDFRCHAGLRNFGGNGSQGSEPRPMDKDVQILISDDHAVDITIEGLPDGFDELAYLARNPDVREVGMSAREHFVRYGRAEGRIWQ